MNWKRLRLSICLAIGLTSFTAAAASSAPYAAYVMDAKSGRKIYSENADTRLHPASLTKMMTLYLAFEAIETGKLRLDSRFKVSHKAANESPSRLGLRANQSVELRYLIRAAAIKSANDAATAIGEGIAGSEDAFAERMNAKARQLGMTNTHFLNAHGLTQKGHYSSARDMSLLGRHLLYDYPQYYNLFSRQSSEALGVDLYHTNRKFLRKYEGADGIKTGYTVAAGFNLTASAERDGRRIIATIFGGTSTNQRNDKMADLLDMGFASAVSSPALVAGLRQSERPIRRRASVVANLPPVPDMRIGGGATSASTRQLASLKRLGKRAPEPRPRHIGGTTIAVVEPLRTSAISTKGPLSLLHSERPTSKPSMTPATIAAIEKALGTAMRQAAN